MSDEEEIEAIDLMPDERLNHFAHFLFYLAVSFIGFGVVVACIQLASALSNVMDGGAFDMEPDGGWLQTILIIAGVSFLIALAHTIALLVSAARKRH